MHHLNHRIHQNFTAYDAPSSRADKKIWFGQSREKRNKYGSRRTYLAKEMQSLKLLSKNQNWVHDLNLKCLPYTTSITVKPQVCWSPTETPHVKPQHTSLSDSVTTWTFWFPSTSTFEFYHRYLSTQTISGETEEFIHYTLQH